VRAMTGHAGGNRKLGDQRPGQVLVRQGRRFPLLLPGE